MHADTHTHAHIQHKYKYVYAFVNEPPTVVAAQMKPCVKCGYEQTTDAEPIGKAATFFVSKCKPALHEVGHKLILKSTEHLRK